MITVKNKLNQPVVVNTENGAIHFLSKEKKHISEEEFNSREVQNHVDLGNIVVLRVE